MLHVPNKTIYVSDGDLPVYQRAQELAGDNLSAAIAAALRRYVDVEEGRREGFDEIVVRVGPRQGPQGPVHRCPPRRLGQHLGDARVFRVYRSRSGKFVLHIERHPDFTMVDEKGEPAGWRGHLGIGNVSYGTKPRRVDARGRRLPGGASEAIPPQLYDIVAAAGPARPSRTWTSDPGGRSAGREASAMTATDPAAHGPREGLVKSYTELHVLRGRTSTSPAAPFSPCSARTGRARPRS